MSWLWLGILTAAGAALWVRRRLMLRRDAMLQESIDRLSTYSDEPKRPPAKQPWKRPGFGPPPRTSVANLGGGPLPPPAGGQEDPDLAGPIPDEDDVPALIPVEELEPEPEAPASAGGKLPPPPPPPGENEFATEASAAATKGAATDAPADEALADPLDEVEVALRRGPRVLELPPELAEEVRGLMEGKQEVAAVRLVCDSMGVGILDAQRTVRSLVGR